MTHTHMHSHTWVNTFTDILQRTRVNTCITRTCALIQTFTHINANTYQRTNFDRTVSLVNIISSHHLIASSLLHLFRTILWVRKDWEQDSRMLLTGTVWYGMVWCGALSRLFLSFIILYVTLPYIMHSIHSSCALSFFASTFSLDFTPTPTPILLLHSLLHLLLLLFLISQST